MKVNYCDTHLSIQFISFMITSRRKADLKDIILKGHLDDATFLLQSISVFHTDAKARQTHLFAVRIPGWERDQMERLKSWLQDIGFEYYYPGGLEMMKYSVKEVNIIFFH